MAKFQGEVKVWKADKGYGFIIGDDDVEDFFHIRELANDYEPVAGDRVEFDRGVHKDGRPRAVRVRRIDD